jgi:anti-sigma B factor antagonist
MTDFTIKRRIEPDQTVTLVAEGELDVFTSARVREELLALEASGEKRINIDLAGIRYLDSTGMSVIIGSNKRLRAEGRELWITGASSQVEKVLTILGMKEWIV